jgi:hypothetical protein
VCGVGEVVVVEESAVVEVVVVEVGWRPGKLCREQGRRL